MDWISGIFSPPPMPDLPVGVIGKIPGARNAIAAIFELAYFSGVRDGGVVFVMLGFYVGFLHGRRRAANP